METEKEQRERVLRQGVAAQEKAGRSAGTAWVEPTRRYTPGTNLARGQEDAARIEATIARGVERQKAQGLGNHERLKADEAHRTDRFAEYIRARNFRNTPAGKAALAEQAKRDHEGSERRQAEAEIAQAKAELAKVEAKWEARL